MGSFEIRGLGLNTQAGRKLELHHGKWNASKSSIQ